MKLPKAMSNMLRLYGFIYVPPKVKSHNLGSSTEAKNFIWRLGHSLMLWELEPAYIQQIYFIKITHMSVTHLQKFMFYFIKILKSFEFSLQTLEVTQECMC